MDWRARWRTNGALLLLLGGCNTFDDPGAGIDLPSEDVGVPPGLPFPGTGPFPGGSFGRAGAGGMPFIPGAAGMPAPAGSSGGWQPIDAGPDSDAGSDDAGQ